MKLPVMISNICICVNKVRCAAVVQETASEDGSAGLWTAQTLLMQVILPLMPDYSYIVLQGSMSA